MQRLSPLFMLVLTLHLGVLTWVSLAGMSSRQQVAGPDSAARLLARAGELLASAGHDLRGSNDFGMPMLGRNLAFRTVDCAGDNWVFVADISTNIRQYFRNRRAGEFSFTYHYYDRTADYPTSLMRKLNYSYRFVLSRLGLAEIPLPFFLLVVRPQTCSPLAVDLEKAFVPRTGQG